MTLHLSPSECENLSGLVGELSHRMRSVLVAYRFALSRHAHLASRLHRLVETCEQLAHEIRVVARRYESGESALQSSLAHVARWYQPVFTEQVAYLSAAAQAWGILKSGPVIITPQKPQICTPVSGFAGAFSRIPTGAPQVRIEKITAAEGERFFVYIGGTKDFALHPTAQPWDMTSNLQALSGASRSDSENAVRIAMQAAGIDAHSQVVLIGHSQGGLIADRIAASGDFNITDVVTAGAPAHTVDVSPAVRLTAFEHTDDIIPALSGVALAGTTALFVRDKAPSIRATSALPAHDLGGYVATAHSADRASDPLVRQRMQRLTSSQGASCSATEFEAKRSLTTGGR